MYTPLLVVVTVRPTGPTTVILAPATGVPVTPLATVPVNTPGARARLLDRDEGVEPALAPDVVVVRASRRS